jgi:hypothetical protein
MTKKENWIDKEDESKEKKNLLDKQLEFGKTRTTMRKNLFKTLLHNAEIESIGKILPCSFETDLTKYGHFYKKTDVHQNS